MATADMRLGLIGLGRIGAFHAQTLTDLQQVGSLVVADAVPAVTAEVAARLGAEPADSPEKLLASSIDGVLIAAATDAHPALLRAAVDAGLPVFCEKPLAAGLADARATADAVRGAPVQIGYPRRFDAGFLAVRGAVAAGELGRVHTVRSTTLDPAPPPRAYLAGSGGLFRDCTVHDLDAVRWVTGQEITEVYATGADRGDPMFGELGDVDAASLLLTMADGSIGVISNSRYNARGYDVRLEVHGAADSAAAGLDDGLPIRPLGPGALAPAGPAHSFFMDRLASAFRAELAAFTELVAGTRPSPCTVDDALAVAVAAEAATVSLREHRPVRTDEIG